MDLEPARGKAKIIAINEGWRLCPWADALYACDGEWWRLNKGLPEFTGLKISQDAPACEAYGLLKIAVRKFCGDIITKPIGELACGGILTGGNGGFQMVNLAAQLGARRIILVGFDMHGEHWHGRHLKGLKNPHERLFAEWRRVLDLAAPILSGMGVEVFNSSPDSTLTKYPVVTLEEALQHD